MELDVLNDSFDGLFEENEGRDWIVTKKEKGQVKVARCAEDEIDDLYITKTDWLVRNVDEDQAQASTSSDAPPNHELHGRAMFLIRDLLNCEYKNNYYFTCKNIRFLDVLICGTVVSLSTRFDKYSIVVDDGTSSIICLIKQQELADMQMSEEDKQSDRELVAAVKANPHDEMAKACAVVMRAIKDIYKNIPTFDDLKLGDTVTITGTLSQHNNKRYVFIKSIEREPDGSVSHVTHLEKLLNLYKESYDEEGG
ncbi:hypothetical protein NQ315_016371 [Exocentrus adspersus]|uniref:OB domain-containing protein n=1 Tax=Exocentrus adspersus TaxID=1586481 RepID=A0AAV8VP89_9CUCU|nr:hypothetical protein NQ315_016371 [Exocentrus adspersus]